MGERACTSKNSALIGLGKMLGLGEKRNGIWFYSDEEMASLSVEFERRKAERIATKANEDEKRKRETAERIATKANETRSKSESRETGLAQMNLLKKFIPDKTVYAAVMFSRKLMRGGMSPGLANWKAGRYYGVPTSEVARHVGKSASEVRRYRSE